MNKYFFQTEHVSHQDPMRHTTCWLPSPMHNVRGFYSAQLLCSPCYRLCSTVFRGPESRKEKGVAAKCHVWPKTTCWISVPYFLRPSAGDGDWHWLRDYYGYSSQVKDVVVLMLEPLLFGTRAIRFFIYSISIDHSISIPSPFHHHSITKSQVMFHETTEWMLSPGILNFKCKRYTYIDPSF
jgi:hypothetical protein